MQVQQNRRLVVTPGGWGRLLFDSAPFPLPAARGIHEAVFRYIIFIYWIAVARHIVGLSSKVGLSLRLLELSMPGARATSASLPGKRAGLMLTRRVPSPCDASDSARRSVFGGLGAGENLGPLRRNAISTAPSGVDTVSLEYICSSWENP